MSETGNTPLDVIRCESLAVAGFHKEATAVSATRVLIDRLQRAYDAYELYDGGASGAELDKAIFGLIRSPAPERERPNVTGVEPKAEDLESAAPLAHTGSDSKDLRDTLGEWRDGVPGVATGKRRRFLIKWRSKHDGKMRVDVAAYCNEHWLEWSDHCDPKDEDVDDNGGKKWTGWMEDRLALGGDEISQPYGGEVVAWMPMPLAEREPLISSGATQPVASPNPKSESVPAASPWIRTAERKPTKEDASDTECVWVTNNNPSSPIVAHYIMPEKDCWKFWMPIPALPAARGAVKGEKEDL